MNGFACVGGRSPGSRSLDHNADSEWNESMEFAAHNADRCRGKSETTSLVYHRLDNLLRVGRVIHAGDG
ncbi:hypothetical protein [Paenibacillus taichungensis]